MKRPNLNSFVLYCCLTIGLIPASSFRASGATPPNIVYILCDDLGYGDVQCLNPRRGKIATPNLDRLGKSGMIFTDAHSGSSVCSPTRYGILTGRYAWRTRLQRGVLNGYDRPLIETNRLTVPALLQQSGYTTACIGKWHLGMAISKSPEELAVMEGPLTRGFDYYYGISASLDMPPFAFIENDHFVVAPTVTKTFLRSGPAAPDFEAVDVLPTLTRKAEDFIKSHAAAAGSSAPGAGKPFFLYMPLNAPHTPIVPTKEWQGKSGLGAYGDFVMETDWAVGQVLAAIEQAGVATNTLVVLTSDNGCSPHAGVTDLERQGHFPSANLRGYKADIWDGGHRIPFLVRWPAVIKPGSVCSQLTCLVDLMSTCADIVGTKLPDTAGEDSASLLPLFKGGDQAVHEAIVHHSGSGLFAIRQGPWKLELCAGSGGWAKPSDAEATKLGFPDVQLYDMNADISEILNRQGDHPEVVTRLENLLEHYVSHGRSTPGAPQQNDVKVNVKKTEETAPAKHASQSAVGGLLQAMAQAGVTGCSE